MTITTKDLVGSSVDVDVQNLSVHEYGDYEWVWSAYIDGELSYFRTVNDPDRGEVIGAILDTRNDELLAKHAARVRKELDNGIV